MQPRPPLPAVDFTKGIGYVKCRAHNLLLELIQEYEVNIASGEALIFNYFKLNLDLNNKLDISIKYLEFISLYLIENTFTALFLKSKCLFISEEIKEFAVTSSTFDI